MFTLPHFCRICLKYDKNLIDLEHIENEPSETLLSKLQFCASEVEWKTYKPLLCHPCIKRLNVSYYFKKECIQSANVLKSYLELLKESQLKNQSQSNSNSSETGQNAGAYMLLPNQKYLKILVGGGPNQNQNSSFQNVFLNVIPSSPPVLVPTDSPKNKNKDTNQNVFLNINNTFKKFVPIAPNENKKKSQEKNVNVNQILTTSKTEELSCEIDPTDFVSVEDDGSSDEEDNEENDWDEVITQSKISSDVSISKVNGGKVKNGQEEKTYRNYVPILPKQATDEDFFTGHHFLSSSLQNDNNDHPDYACEPCNKTFINVSNLKAHIKQFHMGKMPFKCEYCYVEYAVRADYETCVKYHKGNDPDACDKSLTLKDFANIPQTPESMAEITSQNEEIGEFPCGVCRRMFTTSTGLQRHKVRKHNQKNKKKYFIKGMKNARCDICQREFSTQSYMQQHRKLHLRDDVGYKFKVYGKSKYEVDSPNNKNKKSKKNDDEVDEDENEKSKIENEDEEEVENKIKTENLDCTPDISVPEDEESDYEEDTTMEETMVIEPEVTMEVDEEQDDPKGDDNDDEVEEDNNAEDENSKESMEENNHDIDEPDPSEHSN